MKNKPTDDPRPTWAMWLSSSLLHELSNEIAHMRVAALSVLDDSFYAESIGPRLSRIYSIARSLIIDWPILAGEEEPKVRPTSLREVMALVSQNLTNVVPPRQITVEISPGVSEVQADKPFLIPILMNIIDNAYRATPKTELRAPSIKIHEHSGSKAIIDITDHGTGIDPSIRDFLFFEPVRIRGSQAEDRSGIGLFIAQGILAGWGGSIEILESGPDGTTIRVTLQTVTQESEDTSPRDHSESSPTSEQLPPGHPPLKALVVDDSVMFTVGVAELLMREGIEVDTATSINEAVALARSSTYDLAFIDYVFGQGRYGVEIVNTVQQSSPEAVVIVLTGYPDIQLVATAADLQVFDLVLKSDFSMDLLRQRISQALRRRRERNETLRVAYLDTAVNESLSSIAHELRSPLISIKRQVEALNSNALGPLSQQQRHAVDSVLWEARRGLNLVSGHLELNRIEQRIGYSMPVDLDVTGFLETELLLYQAFAAENRVRFDLDLPADGCVAPIDHNKLRIALNPLIENAIKFSPEGGTVRIALRETDGYVKLEISDDGPGMKPSDVRRELGSHSDDAQSPSPRARGTGLGLIISQRAAELHGGSLEIKDDRGQGTKAVLLLRPYGRTGK